MHIKNGHIPRKTIRTIVPKFLIGILLIGLFQNSSHAKSKLVNSELNQSSLVFTAVTNNYGDAVLTIEECLLNYIPEPN